MKLFVGIWGASVGLWRYNRGFRICSLLLRATGCKSG